MAILSKGKKLLYFFVQNALAKRHKGIKKWFGCKLESNNKKIGLLAVVVNHHKSDFLFNCKAFLKNATGYAKILTKHKKTLHFC